MKTKLLIFILSGASIGLLSGCLEGGTLSPPSDVNALTSQPPALMVQSSQSRQEKVADDYIVVLRDGGDPDVISREFEGRHHTTTRARFKDAINGFAAHIPSERLSALKADPRVAFVEPDYIAHAVQSAPVQMINWGDVNIAADKSSTLAGNRSGSVSGVRIFIIDSGIQKDNPDLNIAGGNNFVPSGGTTNASDWTDHNGHGTHVAGIAAAMDNTTYVVGVAPGAPLYSVRVLDSTGSGSYSWILSAINWVTAQKKANRSVPMVANMSLGGPYSAALNQAIASSITAGVVYAVAAGNEGVAADNTSPASVSTALTVGAYDSTMNLASWSNYGKYVDILAPGVNILSTYIGSNLAYASGTSMAAPFVTGSAALYLSKHTTATPAQVASALTSAARANSVNITISGVSRASTTRSSLYVATF